MDLKFFVYLRIYTQALIFLIIALNAGNVTAKVVYVSQLANFTHELCLNKSRNFFQRVACEHTYENLVISPLSGVALAIAAYGEEENGAFPSDWSLHIPRDVAVAKKEYNHLLKTFKVSDNVYLEFSTKMFVSTNLTLKPMFNDVSSYIFHSRLSRIDTSDAKAAANAINRWVDESMNHLVQNITDESHIHVNDKMFLFNAIYFKGKWRAKFDETKTKNETFQVNSIKKTSVPTMKVTGDFVYGELTKIDASFVILPYEDENIKMVIIKPNKLSGLKNIENNLNYIFSYPDLAVLGGERRIHIELPKFVIQNTISLKCSLERTNIMKLIVRSNLNAIANEPVQIGEIFQKIVVEVNEQGGEEETESFTEFMYDEAYLKFEVNVPFLFLITVNDNYILVGRILDPSAALHYSNFLDTNKD